MHVIYKKIQLILSLKVKVRDDLLFDTRGLVFIINTCIHAVVFHMLQTIVKTSDHVMCKKKQGKYGVYGLKMIATN